MELFSLTALDRLYKPLPSSHKGQNGRLLVIGGSKLFHASIFWAADVASKIVDLVHFTSPTEENNELVRQKIKAGFWNGIVVPWEEVEAYIEEDDCILVGPGMVRGGESLDGAVSNRSVDSRVNLDNQDQTSLNASSSQNYDDHGANFDDSSMFSAASSSAHLQAWGASDRTREIVDSLLRAYPKKRWVVDGGALQEVNPELLNGQMIITPHRKEWEKLVGKIQNSELKDQSYDSKVKVTGVADLAEEVKRFSQTHNAVTVLLKGEKDLVCQGNTVVLVEGGNPGMTKGGTGDVLAGLVAALYCKNEAFLAAQAASWVNKKAGDELFKRVGIYFNAGDLVGEVPRLLGRIKSQEV